MTLRQNFLPACLMLLLTLLINACGFHRAIVHGVPGLEDHKKFPVRTLLPDTTNSFHFFNAANMLPDSAIPIQHIIDAYNQKKEHIDRPVRKRYQTFGDFLRDSETVALIIIRNDTVIYENFLSGYTRESEFSSYSMTKSFVSLLTGCAIEDGYIDSIDDVVSKYVPEMASNGFDRVTIRHLLQMTSGTNFRESYLNPYRGLTELYLSEDLRASTANIKVRREPGSRHYYSSGDSQLLGLVLHHALDTMSITQYMQGRLWGPLGMEYQGSWIVDNEHNGLEKTFCCLSAAPYDFARFGRLMMHHGSWNGSQLISEEWVKESIKTDSSDGSHPMYQYSWRVTENYFSAYGYAGQVLLMYPEKEMILLRFGESTNKLNWRKFLAALAESL